MTPDAFDARGTCGNCGGRSLVTFAYRNGFEACPGCQSEYRQRCAENARDEERARKERDALAARKGKK